MEWVIGFLGGVCVYLFITLMNVKTEIDNMKNNVSEQQMYEAIHTETDRMITMHLNDCHRTEK